eukprot:3134946-Alexandrium_andersonii.AAC.1
MPAVARAASTSSRSCTSSNLCDWEVQAVGQPDHAWQPEWPQSPRETAFGGAPESDRPPRAAW